MRISTRTLRIGLVTVALAAPSLWSAALAQGQDNTAQLLQWAKQTRSARGPSDIPGGLGMIPSSEEDFARSAHAKIVPARRDVRPARLLLTRYLPPVANQGKQGSCVAWSSAYYAYTYAVSKQRKLGEERLLEARFLFSPAYIYNLGNGGGDRGMSIAKGFETLGQRGCASLADMPYNPEDYSTLPSDSVQARARRYLPRDRAAYLFRSRPDVEKLKTFLAVAQVPFVMGIPIFRDFPRGKVDEDFVYNLTEPPSQEKFGGLHAITIIGYDDSKRAFRMVNSWGPNWGDRGFLWLSEDFVRDWALEGWAHIAPGGVVARAGNGGSVTLVMPKRRTP